MRAGLLALLEHRDGHLAEPLGHLGVLLEQLPEPDRARKPGRPRADDQDSDLDPLVAGSVGGATNSRGENGGGKSAAAAHPRLRAWTSSVSFGTISCRSPTTPRSPNSKIGAFGPC